MKTSLAVLLLMIATSLTFAQPRGMNRREIQPDDKPSAGMVRQLDLTDDQQPQFDKLTSALMKKQIGVRSKIQTARVDLHDLSPDNMGTFLDPYETCVASNSA